MTNHLKALGLALLAAFALSAFAASAASAASDVFTSDSPNELTDLTGVSEGKSFLETEKESGLSVSCETATYTGTEAGSTLNEVTAHPKYEGDCTSLGLNTNVNTDGCDYILTGDTSQGDATVGIECTEDDSITIEVGVPTPILVFHITEQDELVGVTYENDGDSVVVNATVEGITVECTGSLAPLICEEHPNALSNWGLTNAYYQDEVTVSGYEDIDDFVQNPITHEWLGSHGNQVNLDVHPR